MMLQSKLRQITWNGYLYLLGNETERLTGLWTPGAEEAGNPHSQSKQSDHLYLRTKRIDGQSVSYITYVTTQLIDLSGRTTLYVDWLNACTETGAASTVQSWIIVSTVQIAAIGTYDARFGRLSTTGWGRVVDSVDISSLSQSTLYYVRVLARSASTAVTSINQVYKIWAE
jgi:hypothetical protein